MFHPVQPELLSGTLRQNLDLFDQHDDAVLYDALRAAGLFSVQDEFEEGRLTLDSVIASGGTNLSVGQRQILALARAMVRGSKLLILDEATSAIGVYLTRCKFLPRYNPLQIIRPILPSNLLFAMS